MTVIVCHKGVMVADRQYTKVLKNKTITKGGRKIYDFKGMYLASCGNARAGYLMERWFMNGAFEKDVPTKICKRHLDPKYNWKGTRLIVVVKILGVFVYRWGDANPKFVGGGTCAFGSGGGIALGAIEHGATAEEAARTACIYSNDCGYGLTKRNYW